MFTINEKEKYRKDRSCPYCNCKTISSVENVVKVINNDKSIQLMKCKKCKKKWNEVYPMFDIEEIGEENK